MKILLICPVPPEFKACCSELSLNVQNRIGKSETITGNPDSSEILALHTGPGKKNIIKRLPNAVNEYNPDIIIDTGSCCSLNDKINIGDIIFALSSYQFKENNRLDSFIAGLEQKKQEVWFKKVFTIAEKNNISIYKGIQVSDSFIIDSETKKKNILSKIKAEAYNWETAYVYEAAEKLKIPALSLRIITDLGNKTAIKDFYKNIKIQSGRLYNFVKILCNKKLFIGL